MRYMVTLTPKPDSTDTIRGLVAAEQQRVAELRQAGIVEQLYVNRPGRAWLVLLADSVAEAEHVLASLPLHPHIDASVESLIG